jgi:hypothetical protein
MSVALAYTATVVANTIRIVVALWLAAHPIATDFWTAPRIHRLQGIAVYFGMLIALHSLVQRLANTSQATAATFRQASLPLAAYYLVTVLVPLANGSGDMRGVFLEHMVFVLLAPPALVVVFALARRACRRRGAAATTPTTLSTQRSG